MKEKKQAYERPALRKVRLEVKTSVLVDCNTSVSTTPVEDIAGCNLTGCYNYPTTA